MSSNNFNCKAFCTHTLCILKKVLELSFCWYLEEVNSLSQVGGWSNIEQECGNAIPLIHLLTQRSVNIFHFQLTTTTPLISFPTIQYVTYPAGSSHPSRKMARRHVSGTRAVRVRLAHALSRVLLKTIKNNKNNAVLLHSRIISSGRLGVKMLLNWSLLNYKDNSPL